MVKATKIKVGASFIRVSPWRFGLSPDRCFKCLEFGHSSQNCSGKEKCLRCAKEGHSHKSCKGTDPKDFRCANCCANHAACSKICPELNKAVEEKKLKLERKANKNNEKFTRIYSESYQAPANNLNQKNLYNLVSLIVDLFRNLSMVTAAANEDPTPIIKLIAQNLGHEFSNNISHMLFKNQDQIDPNMANRYMELEHDQI
ncbi:unnamed protein product [Brachionus calyciflorus]|uniref:CCHC-type domain-containing protein n=1 Tax=Brachionus calyciflorus TaxID=104777 RepID=A0A814M3B0_9BILA|nr:unnamed protein product [Brachionus calyciflorus]